MTRLTVLPQIMLAPNGARKTKADHPALPMTIAETVAAARAAHAEGAGALHAHVRDAEGGHSLDPGLYRELIAEMARVVPEMPVQITTEAAGRYSPADQRAVVRGVLPEGVSVALSEMWPANAPDDEASRFYHWAAEAGIAVQHILYSPVEVVRLSELARRAAIPAPLQLLYVLGRYLPPQPATPEALTGFLTAASALPERLDWAACAFGPQETDCLLAAIKAGGKARIGFENNLTFPDGTPAPDNAARVADFIRRLPLSGQLSSRNRIPPRASSPL
ncbi:3-keto-5-aminohexanoate cleavage protein [Nioella sp.]|uniref:3-keto-5-aminohexanoate cleavage protein n=1 Tax=Nioella sp. TaxID=1912091 RepID=UPI003A8816BD